MLARDVKQAAHWTWRIVSVVLLCVALAPFIVPADALASVAPVCQAKRAGGQCALCGMTTAFLRIGAADWRGAAEAHRASVAVWSLFLVNFAVAGTYSMMRRLSSCKRLR